jgi:aryl-alcohol dehydrogenase-like predicted oxidoreductase
MPQRVIAGQRVAPIGFGCMNLSHAYGAPPPPGEGIAVVRRALDLGVTYFDTAALYGFGRNESLVGEALGPSRSRVYLASKCGMTGVDGRRVIDGRPETLKRTCRESLSRLRTDYIDLYYLHRCDPAVPVEDSIGALAELVAAGLVRAVGLSEVSAATLRRANAVHPIAAVQSEYSLWTRNPEVAVLAECARLGAAFVAFSPLARGFLADGIADPAQFQPNDIRRGMPRFAPEHFAVNVRLLDSVRALAAEAGCRPAHLALMWLLTRAPHVLPIPGTTSIAHLEENVAAAHLRVDSALLARLEALVNPSTVSGARYNAATQAEIDTEELPAGPRCRSPV